MINITNQTHLVQTKKWNKFKSTYGTRVENTQGFYFLVKKIPFSNKYMGYAPKVNYNKVKIDYIKLKGYCTKNNIAFIRFDVPNVVVDQNNKNIQKQVEKFCKKAPRNTFTKENIYLDITKSEEELLKNMHHKRRYNIRYALKNGVKVEIKQGKKAFDTFYKLHDKTAKRQGFLKHSKDYFEKAWKVLGKDVYFVQAKVGGKVAVSWFVVVSNKTIYYVYGGSNPESNKLHPSDLVGFETIKLGKSKNCTLFDMWGAEQGKGFTDFKLKYGSIMLSYMPSQDFIVNKLAYYQFNVIYEGFWLVRSFTKKLGF
jgi:lipid II:glycine glycyltransferase (peptidoglycan interpeptide bridge formation enzyme)